MESFQFPPHPSKNLQKTAVILVLAICTIGTTKAQTVLWSQNFNDGGPVSNYVGTGTNQLDAISTSGTGLVWSINGDNQLQAVRTADSGAASRVTDINLGTVQAGFLRLGFDATSIGTSTSGFGYAINVAVGSGFATSNFLPAQSNIFAQYGFSTLSTGNWTVRNIAGNTFHPVGFSDIETVTLVFNNSGTGQSYNFGDGVSGATANDTFDLWVGSTLIFDNAAVTTASLSSITDFKIGWYGNGTGSVVLDNMSFGSIPEPSTALLLGAGAMMILWRIRRSNRVG